MAANKRKEYSLEELVSRIDLDRPGALQKTKQEFNEIQESQKSQNSSTRSLLSNIISLTMGVGLAVLSVSLLAIRSNSLISREAVVNGTIVDLKVPSSGRIKKVHSSTGKAIEARDPIASLSNERLSKLEVQQISSELNAIQSELATERDLLQRKLKLLETMKLDLDNQTRLEIQMAQQSLEQVIHQRESALARRNVAQKDFERSKKLVAAGVQFSAKLDRARLKLEESNAEINLLEAQLREMQANKNAAQLGLSLQRSASNFDPRIRLQETELEIAELQKSISNKEKAIEDTQAELTAAKTDLAKHSRYLVTAPTTGVIWALSAREGQFLQEGEDLGKLLDCSRRWVDVYVDERAIRKIQPGTTAEIELRGSEEKLLTGQVSSVRSGLGRLAVGEEEAFPLVANIPRHSHVRIDIDSTDINSNKNQIEANKFCYVGYTAKVKFKT